MIHLRRPRAEVALDTRTQSYLDRKSSDARKFTPRDVRVGKAWAAFLGTQARDKVAEALDAYTKAKCAYCEQIAAKDIEHFWPKTLYPARMFDWENFLRGCKNCNNAKRDRFPTDGQGKNLLLDPCEDEPLDHFVWDGKTGAAGVVPDPSRAERGVTTIDLFQLNQEPIREERRLKYLVVLYLLARLIDEYPIEPETRERLREELLPQRPWLGIVRQLLLRPEDTVRPLVERALAKLPEIRDWAADWI
ncbi:MAG: retron system putative HNH endonuclease [Isosphaeraceae bacterium]